MEKKRKNILLIATGGTIASGATKGGLAPVLSSKELLEYTPEIGANCHIDTIQLCNIDSTNVTPKDWLLFAGAIQENYNKYDGFVVCHGTDTMAYTACALSYLIQNPDKPVILTGAQKPISMDITDAKTNLRDSVHYACDDDAKGVVLVFDGKVIAGTRAKKMKTKSYHAFSSINYPELAVILDTQIIQYIHLEQKESKPLFYQNLGEKVFLLKVTPGMSPEILDFVFKKYDCVVLESFGSGGIPDSLMGEFVRVLKQYEHGEKIVIMTTQVMHEGSDVEVYEVGKRVREYTDFLEACDMTLEAVITKIMWIMGIPGLSWEEKRTLFYRPVNFDIAFEKQSKISL